MSHGGGESGRVHERSQNGKRKSIASGDEFAQAILKIAVAQICESVGFQTFQQSALETLSDVTVQYIRSIGKTAHSYANLGGRTEENPLDVIQGLEDLGSAQGFAGASDADHCLSSSGTVREIIQYVGEEENIPFAYSIPSFPVHRERKLAQSFLQNGEEPPEEHIPAWLPAFPNPETYLQLHSGNEGAVDSHVKKIEPARQGNTGGSLLDLQHQFACNGSKRPLYGASLDVSQARQAAEGNPFLAAPLPCGEKEVSRILPPAKLSKAAGGTNLVEQNHVLESHGSFLDSFAPAIEAMKSGSCDSRQGQKVLLHQRPAVQFKIGVGKKSFSAQLDSKPWNKGVKKISPLFEMDNDKDDNKKRAENILKQSIDNPGELAHL